jgi:hypothetical protein
MHSHKHVSGNRGRGILTHRRGSRLWLYEGAAAAVVAVVQVEAAEATTICTDRDGRERAIEPVRGRDDAFLFI